MDEFCALTENNCNHNVLKKGVCVNCGECIDECEFKDTYTDKQSNNNIQYFLMKYLYKDPSKQFISKIKKILVPLNLEYG